MVWPTRPEEARRREPELAKTPSHCSMPPPWELLACSVPELWHLIWGPLGTLRDWDLSQGWRS